MCIRDRVKNASKLEKVARLKSWMPTVDYDDDEAVSTWIEDHHTKLQKRIEELKQESTRQNINKLVHDDPENGIAALKDLISSLPDDEKAEFLKSLK